MIALIRIRAPIHMTRVLLLAALVLGWIDNACRRRAGRMLDEAEARIAARDAAYARKGKSE